VPRGVRLRERPIFLGGQGGLVGPARIGFGMVTAAGLVRRGDCPEGGMLLMGENGPAAVQPFHPGLYGDIRRHVTNNILYIANLLALRQWYLHVRLTASADEERGDALWKGALSTLEAAIAERIARFRALAEKREASLEMAENLLHGDLREAEAGRAERDGYCKTLAAARAAQGSDPIRVIRSLDPDARAMGTAWLNRVVDAVAARAWAEIPACRG
jgi:hypothetical protein